MRKLAIFAMVCLVLCACSSRVTEEDYKKALVDYVGDEALTPGGVTLAHVSDITVADSIDFYAHALVAEYNGLLATKKVAWEEKQADCEKDEKAIILRHEDYMKKYKDAKRQYGNNVKYKNRIEGYLKAAQKLPSNHEEYVKFDRSRSYSFTRDAENLQADYEQFLQMGVDGYVAQHPSVAQYELRDKNEVIATVYNATYTTAKGNTVTGDFVFGYNPLSVVAALGSPGINILNYKEKIQQ